VSSAGTVTRPPERVLLLSESVGLAAILGRLLDGDDRLTQAGSLREAAEEGGLAGADAVVLDTLPDARLSAVEHLRRDYQGPLVVLVEPGADAGDLPQDEAATLLARPFAAEDLGAVLGLPPLASQPGRGRPRPPVAAEADAANRRAPPADPDAGEPPRPTADESGGHDVAATLDRVAAARLAASRQPGGWPTTVPADRSGWWRVRHRVEALPAELVHAWRARRWVRMAGFWTVCLLAFLIAFVLAAQDNSLGAVDVTPLPTVEVDPPGAPTTPGRVPESTAGRTGTPGTGGFRGTFIASTTTAARATTTTIRAVPGGGGTTRPPTTRQATTSTNGATTTTNDQSSTTDTTITGP
jgi:hypothetical protein